MQKIIFSFVCALVALPGVSQKDNHSKYAIKYSPTQLIFGELHFAYEQRITPQSSIELSLGPTISEIGVTPLLMNNVNNTFGPVRRESALGFFGSLAFRYYPISGLATAPRGLYIGPEFRYRLYNTTYVDEFYNLGEKTGTATQLSFRFYTGYQFWLGSKFSIDVFTAVGVGTTSVTVQNNLLYSNSSGSLVPLWESSTRSRVMFTGAFGFKFGIGGTRKDK